MDQRELFELAQSLLYRYERRAKVVETDGTSFLEHMGSKKNIDEEMRFETLSYQDENDNYVASHTPAALNKEIDKIKDKRIAHAKVYYSDIGNFVC